MIIPLLLLFFVFFFCSFSYIVYFHTFVFISLWPHHGEFKSLAFHKFRLDCFRCPFIDDDVYATPSDVHLFHANMCAMKNTASTAADVITYNDKRHIQRSGYGFHESTAITLWCTTRVAFAANKQYIVNNKIGQK